MHISYHKALLEIVLGCIIICSFFSCSGSNCSEDLNPEDIDITLEMEALEGKLFALKSPKQIQSFLDEYPTFSERFMNRSRLPNDTVLVESIQRMIAEPHLRDTLLAQVNKVYDQKQREKLKFAFTKAFYRIKQIYPDFKIPKIYTVITGLGTFFGNDFYVGPDMIVVSLDFFLGDEALYRPPVEIIPDYIWKRYTPEAIVPLAIRQISQQFIQTDFADQTVLAEMIFYGKAHAFVQAMMPCLPDSLLTGYSSQELALLDNSEARNYLWNHFISEEILFSTDQKVKQGYLGERPYIAEIQNVKAPGRLGRWFGWRICQKYQAKNKEVTLKELLAQPDARMIFNKSGYQAD